jgi:hypothetical protein
MAIGEALAKAQVFFILDCANDLGGKELDLAVQVGVDLGSRRGVLGASAESKVDQDMGARITFSGAKS